MIKPKLVNLDGVVGGKFDQYFHVWADKKQTEPYMPATTDVFVFELDGIATVSSATGAVTIEPGDGAADPVVPTEVTVHIPGSATSAATGASNRYRLKLVGADPADPEFLVYGAVNWTDPS